MKFSRETMVDLAWIVGGICFAFMAVHQIFWWLFIPAFCLVIFAFHNTHSRLEVAWWSLYIGIIKALGELSPVWHVYPLTWIDLGGTATQLAFIVTFWLTSAIAMGVPFVAVGLVVYFIYKRRMLWAAVTLPFFWVVGEILGSLGAAVAFLGPGSGLNIEYGHYYTGFAISHLAILFPLIKFGGVYVLSGLTAAIGVIFYLAVISRTRIWISVAIILCVLTGFSYLLTPDKTDTIGVNVIAVELEFPSSEYHKTGGPRLKAENIVDATLAALKQNPDIIILPEDARLTGVSGDASSTLQFLLGQVPDSKTLVIDTSYTEDNGHGIQRAYYYDLKRQRIYEIDKQYLVAEGEYVSYLFTGILRLVGRGELAAELNKNINYRPGPKKDYENFPTDVPGVMFCYDSSSIFGAYNIKKTNQYPLIVHAASHSWFHSPSIYWGQLDDMLRVQAIWNQTTIVRAGNMVPSQAYLPNGEIIIGEEVQSGQFWQLMQYQF